MPQADKAVLRKGDKKLVPSPPAKVSKADPPLPTDDMELEQKQSEYRTAESDSDLYASSCDHLKQLLDEMMAVKLELRKKSAEKGAMPKEMLQGAQRELADLRVKFSLTFLNLKKLNRLDKIRTKRIRDGTNSVMQKVDSFHLQLQNLRYEVLHLKKEVTKCLQFRSRDKDVVLVPAGEFYAKAPNDVKDKIVDPENEHQVRLAMLEFEHLQRKEMHKEQEELDRSRRECEKKIVEKRTNIACLKPQLASILEKTKVVQSYLDLPLSEERDQQDYCRHLPSPLFVLFSEMRAYGRACDRSLKVVVKGDIEEAKSANAAKRNRVVAEEAEEEEEEEEEEGNRNRDEEVDDDEGRKAKGAKKRGETVADPKMLADPKSGAMKELFVVHPLTVQVALNIDSQNFVELCFSYLTNLEIVTVKVNLVLSKENRALTANRDILGASTLLSHLLMDNDFGNTSPNPSTVYILKSRVGLDRMPPATLDEHGAAYLWAQTLGGLDFPADARCGSPEDEGDDCSPPAKTQANRSACQTHIELIVGSIRERFRSRIALQQQLAVLEKAKLTQVLLPIPKEFENEAPANIQNRIRAWSSVSWEQYVALEVTSHLVGEGAVSCNDFFYRMQLNREPATLIALISVGANYPSAPPVFCLNLHWNGEHNVHNSERVRALERHVNTCYADLVRKKRRANEADPAHFVLSLQIRRLMVCLDVLLESWNHAQDYLKVDFPREKIFLQAVRGRTRAAPLKYQQRLQMFSQ